MEAPDSVEAFYQRELARPERAITAHLPRLRVLASLCRTVVEFGVKRGASSSALLLGGAEVFSYDIVETKEARLLERLAGPQWHYAVQDSRKAVSQMCDLLFIDSLHTYAQVDEELKIHAGWAHRWLVFHDVLTFGSIGADGETGRWSWTPEAGKSVPVEHLGIRPAIDALMIREPNWHIAASYPDSHGLLVLERR